MDAHDHPHGAGDLASDHSLLGDLGLAVFALIMIGFLGFSVVDAYDRYKRKMAKKHDR